MAAAANLTLRYPSPTRATQVEGRRDSVYGAVRDRPGLGISLDYATGSLAAASAMKLPYRKRDDEGREWCCGASGRAAQVGTAPRPYRTQ